MSARVISRLFQLIRHYWLPFALLVFLAAPFLAPTRNAMKTSIYICTLLPALLVSANLKYLLYQLRRCPLLLFFVLFLIYLCVSTFWAPRGEPDDPFTQMFYVFLLVYGLGVHLKLSEQRMRALLFTGCLAGALGAALTLAMLALHVSGVLEGGRIIGYGALLNPLLSGNLYGCYLVILLGLGTFGQISRPGWIMAISIGILILALIIGTGSRSPLLAIAVAATVLLLRRRDHRTLQLWVALAVTLSVATFFFWKNLTERGLSLRPEIWLKVILLCLQKPWLGHGFDSNIELTIDDGYVWYDTHNLLLTLWYFSGAPAVIGWLGINALLLRRLWQAEGSVGAVALGLLSYGMVTTFFEGSGLPSRPTEFWYQIWLPITLGFWELTRERTTSAHSLTNSV